MIHPTARIAASVTLGNNVSIGAFTVIADGVSIGDDVTIASHCNLSGHVTIQNESAIFSHVSITAHATQHITIETHTTLREFITLEAKTAPIKVGNNAFIMAYCSISSGVSIAEHVILTNSVTLHEAVTLHERVIIGGLSTINSGVTIGSGVMVGGASHIKKDIAPFLLCEGSPATIKGVNVIGLRRRYNDKALIQSIMTLYKRIFRSDEAIVLENVLEHTDSNDASCYFVKFLQQHPNAIL